MKSKLKSILIFILLISFILILTGCRDYRVSVPVANIESRPFTERPTVAIMPFKNNSKRQIIQAGDSVSSLLRTRLGNTDRYRMIPENDIKSLISSRTIPGKISVGKALNIGQKLEADYIITGIIQNVKISTSDQETEVRVKIGVQLINIDSQKVIDTYRSKTFASDTEQGTNIERQLIWTAKNEAVNKTVNHLVKAF